MFGSRDLPTPPLRWCWNPAMPLGIRKQIWEPFSQHRPLLNAGILFPEFLSPLVLMAFLWLCKMVQMLSRWKWCPWIPWMSHPWMQRVFLAAQQKCHLWKGFFHTSDFSKLLRCNFISIQTWELLRMVVGGWRSPADLSQQLLSFYSGIFSLDLECFPWHPGLDPQWDNTSVPSPGQTGIVWVVTDGFFLVQSWLEEGPCCFLVPTQRELGDL